MQTTAAVSQTALDSLLNDLATQLDRTNSSIQRIYEAGKRLELDSPTESEQKDPEPPRFNEGVLYGLQSYIKTLAQYNDALEFSANKLQRLI